MVVGVASLSPFAKQRVDATSRSDGPCSSVRRCNDGTNQMDDPRADHADPATQQPRADLWAIVYVSKAARAVTRDDLLHILEGARRRNAEEGITGVLLYANGYFMQYLEGPEAGLHKVYAIIKTHPLHYGLIDLVREPVPAREFAEWSMACHVVGTGSESPLSDRYELLASRMGAVVSTRSAACSLVSHFWAEGRKSIAPALLSHRNAVTKRRLSARPDGRTAD